MEQHALPQDITTYRFRLVGSMTLKQFLELASGIVTAWLVFNSPMNFLIKWSLAPTLAFLGFALAFIPIEDRPLDQWILNFFKAIYQPTQFIFKQAPKDLDFMAPVKISPPRVTDGTEASPELMEDYLKTLPSSPTTAFDSAEQKYLDYIHSLFGALGSKISPKIVKASSQPSAPAKTVRGVRVRKLMHPQMCLLPHANLYQAPPEPTAAAMPAPAPKTTAAPVSVKPVAKTTTPPTPTAKSVTQKQVAVAAKPKPAPSTVAQGHGPQSKTAAVTETVFAQDVLMPQSPEKPNLVSGITMDEKGKILPNVILEIKDNKGLPVRALKSNKLGQFFIATPLEDGVYQIEAEAANKRFAIMKLEAKNEIIPPLKIQAQG